MEFKNMQKRGERDIRDVREQRELRERGDRGERGDRLDRERGEMYKPSYDSRELKNNNRDYSVNELQFI
jgi:hypothetical protein